MKQTAVGFLMDKLFDSSTMIEEQIQWFHQAAQMEKEQIMDAFNSGYNYCYNRELEEQDDDLEIDYYNETFNTKEK